MRAMLLCLLWLAGGLSAEELSCPATVKVRQVAQDVPAGWTSALSTVQPRLAGVTFFDGKPEDEASLVYDRMTPSRNGMRATWTFAANSHIWLSCNYTGTNVVLSRALPAVTRCTVLYRKEGTALDVDRIFCR
jgi:hypothetical protein